MTNLLWSGYRSASVEDSPGVLIPLGEAHLHSHSTRSRPPSDLDDALLGQDDEGVQHHKDPADDENTGMLLEMGTEPEYSIEGLRREVRRGNKGGEKWTDYESEILNNRGLAYMTCYAKLFYSEIEAHQQGYPRHWDGEI